MGHRWSLAVSGSPVAEGAAIAAHGEDVIIAGSFQGPLEIDTPPGDARPLTSAGDSDVFVARLDARGHVVWRQRLGGPGADRASAAAADAGRIVLGLELTPSAEPAGIAPGDRPRGALDPAGPAGPAQPARIDAALIALRPDGEIAWRHTLASSRHARISAIALLDDGGAAVAGTFAGTIRVGNRALTSAGSTDVFVARLDPGGAPAWALRLGGPGADTAQALAAWSGRLVVAGNFDGNVDVGAHLVEAPSAFVLALAEGGAPAWLRLLGPEAMPQALALSPASPATPGALYLAGHFRGSLQLGAHALDSHGQTDAFLGRLDDQGAPHWLVQLGGPGIEHARALAVTSRGVILGGTFEDRLAAGQRELASAGASDAFVVELDGEAGALLLARRFGGPGYDELTALAARADVLVMTGSFEGTLDLDDRAITAPAQRSAFVLALDL